MNEPIWMLTEEAAKYAGMSAEVLARLARQGRIKAGSDGRKWRFRAEWIDEFFIVNGRRRS